MEHYKKEFKEKFVEPKSGLRATTLNNEPVIIGTFKEVWDWIEKIIKAFGGCDKCYGKGYSTEAVRNRTSPDFIGDKEYVKDGVVINFCSCDRGKQLERLVGIK